jgi:hypothetical protein
MILLTGVLKACGSGPIYVYKTRKLQRVYNPISTIQSFLGLASGESGQQAISKYRIQQLPPRDRIHRPLLAEKSCFDISPLELEFTAV